MTGFWQHIQPSLSALSVSPDEWVRRMMTWHFDSSTGSPFWLARKPLLDFDPVCDIGGVDDLVRFGAFDSQWLRESPVQDLIPRGYAGQPHRVFETGGTTGQPVRIVDFVRGRYDVAIYSAFLAARGHVRSGDVLALTPSGPHAYGWFVSRLADSWGGSVHYIDFDPRWVKLQPDRGADAYIEHLLDQAERILADNRVEWLFTTAKLLLRLCLRRGKPLADLGLKAVCTGGTSCTAEEEAVLRAHFLRGIDWIDTYGNTLLGHALQSDPEEDGGTRSYHLPPPLGLIRVSDPADWTQTVGYGERGRVVITTLLDDLFIPNLAERDSALRAPPSRHFPWDGVSAVAPLWTMSPDSEVAGVEGVY
jgi:phenylacetate-coenzyme A ligase PaaK-like adenylate-forming protein